MFHRFICIHAWDKTVSVFSVSRASQCSWGCHQWETFSPLWLKLAWWVMSPLTLKYGYGAAMLRWPFHAGAHPVMSRTQLIMMFHLSNLTICVMRAVLFASQLRHLETTHSATIILRPVRKHGDGQKHNLKVSNCDVFFWLLTFSMLNHHPDSRWYLCKTPGRAVGWLQVPSTNCLSISRSYMAVRLESWLCVPCLAWPEYTRPDTAMFTVWFDVGA